MTQFQQHSLGRRFARGGSPAPIPRQGITQEMAAPNVPVGTQISTSFAPIDTSSTRKALELMQALGMVGNIAQQAGQLREQFRRSKKEAELFERGLGARHARESLPELLDLIDRREIMADIGEITDDGVPAFVDAIIDGLAADVSPAYSEALRDGAKPTLLKALLDQREGMREEVKRGMGQDLRDAAILAEDAAGIRVTVERAQSIGFSENEALAMTALRAMESAAGAGDGDRFSAAKEVLGDSFAFEQRKFAQTLSNRLAAMERETVHAAQQSVFGLLNDGVAFDTIREKINEFRNAPLSESDTDQLLRLIDSREREGVAEVRRAMNDQYRAQVEEAVAGAAVETMNSAFDSGGATVIEDVTYEDLDGRTHTITARDQIQTATRLSMAEIATKAETPEQAISEQVEYLSRNGGVVFEPWQRTMDAGFFAVATDLPAVADGKQRLPANTINGYEVYRQVHVRNPRLADAHVTNTAAKRFYDAAILAEKYVTPGDSAGALMLATRAFARREPFAGGMGDSFREKDFNNALSSAMKSGFWPFTNQSAVNNAEVAGKIHQLGRFYVEVLGVNPADAVKEAGQRIADSHTIINKWAVETGNLNVPRDIDETAQAIIEEYVARHGADEGVRAKDLTLIPGETEGSWLLYNRVGLAPVERWRTEGLFTNPQLAAMGDEFAKARQDASKAAVIKRQNFLRSSAAVLQRQREIEREAEAFRRKHYHGVPQP